MNSQLMMTTETGVEFTFPTSTPICIKTYFEQLLEPVSAAAKNVLLKRDEKEAAAARVLEIEVNTAAAWTASEAARFAYVDALKGHLVAIRAALATYEKVNPVAMAVEHNKACDAVSEKMREESVSEKVASGTSPCQALLESATDPKVIGALSVRADVSEIRAFADTVLEVLGIEFASAVNALASETGGVQWL